MAWIARVARLLREEGIDASPAQVVDATRLASTLAALRGRPVASLDELTEAVRAALLGGDDTALAVIRDRLIVGEALGAVPERAPSVPLQASLAREQKRLRLPPDATQRTLEHAMWIRFHAVAVLERARLSLVRIDRDDARAGLGPDEIPLL